jgi:hypothetical protein
MRTKTLAALLACSFLLLLLQLIAVLFGPVIGALCGAMIAIFSFLLVAFFQVELQAVWVKVLLPTTSSLAGVALVFFARAGQTPRLWLAPLLAFAVSLTVAGIDRLRSRRCGLCNHSLGDGVAFECPRCGLVVCDRTCWVFEHLRCRLCEQNRVPIFVPDSRWWDKQFGPRSAQGRCQLCMVPAQEADLRACKKCGRPLCRDCWDCANGQCNHCKWIVEDLPESLHPYMVALTRP